MNKITRLFNIKYPIIQGGMVWNSGYKLASAVSNCGGLGLIGAGSMHPDILREHIQKCKKNTSNPFGVNVPMLYPDIQQIIDIIIEERVPIVFTSAGNPKTWTPLLKQNGIKVAHVVSSTKFALKAQEAGVDAVVAEGFEAGGHNGKEETTTFTLIPMIKEQIKIPVIAAGGIATGKGIHAAMVLGADAVQLGTRFALTTESSSHEAFKQYCISSKEGDTILTLKEIAPVRILKNTYYHQIQEAYNNGFTVEELKKIQGKGRSKKGMFEGNLEEGELEIGQISGLIHEIKSVNEIMTDLIEEYNRSISTPLHRF